MSLFMHPGIDRGRLPVLLLGGFLGSGKTTLVNALLRDPRLAETAVAVNEFGDVPLDSHLIDDGADRTVLLANGCLCCTVSGDLEGAVMRIFARREAGALRPFARLLIEPSGLADPAPILQAILRNPVMARVLRLAGTLCTVDALFAERQLAAHPQARKQVALADRLIVTKPDLVDPAALQNVHALIRRHNPLASIVTVEHGGVDPASVVPPSWIDPAAPDPAAPPAPARSAMFADDPADPGHAARTQVVRLAADRPLDWRRFEAWLRAVRIAHGDHLLRLKAVLRVSGCAAPLALQGVHHVLHAPVELAHWPDHAAGSRIVMLTQGLDPGTIERSWAAAVHGLIAAQAA
jgi:G3E family GTPase